MRARAYTSQHAMSRVLLVLGVLNYMYLKGFMGVASSASNDFKRVGLSVISLFTPCVRNQIDSRR